MTGTTLNYTQIYTTQQAAEVLQINVQTVRKYIREGKLKASRFETQDYRITGEDIKSFLDGCDKKHKKGGIKNENNVPHRC